MYVSNYDIIIGAFPTIVLMITVKGYLIDKIFPTGYITNNGLEALTSNIAEVKRQCDALQPSQLCCNGIFFASTSFVTHL